MVRVVFVTLVACVALTACFNEDPFAGVWKNTKGNFRELHLNEDGTGFFKGQAFEDKITWERIDDTKIVISISISTEPLPPVSTTDVVMELRDGTLMTTSGGDMKLSKTAAVE